MRARLRQAWPALSKHFGLHPWDTERLSIEELNAYLRAVEELSKPPLRGGSRGK